MKKLFLIALAVVGVLGVTSTKAAEFDGSQKLICASVETYGCIMDFNCIKGTAETINIPQFFRIDFDKGLIHATRPDGKKRTTKIVNRTHENGQIYLQGVQSELGWSMAINEETGKMSLTASGDKVAYTVFGACTPLK